MVKKSDMKLLIGMQEKVIDRLTKDINHYEKNAINLFILSLCIGILLGMAILGAILVI